MKTINTEQKLTIQLWLGIFLAVSGICLLTMGLWMPPLGKIDSSVLVAFGEIGTFSGALIGIDFKYKYEIYKIHKE